MKTLAMTLAALTLSLGAASAEDADIGETLYIQTCAACHGATALGDGPAASFMSIQTPNLTTISARNDGVFPMLDVIQVIDGRNAARAHGGEMPIWGSIYSADSAAIGIYGSALETRGRIMSLAQYLESIQR